MEVPLYQLFYDGEQPPKAPELPKNVKGDKKLWGATGKDARTLGRFLKFLSRTSEKDRKVLLSMAQKMANASR